QDMLRNMGSRDGAAATKTRPVIDVNEVKRPLGGRQTIPTIDVQAQDLARLPGQRIETCLINGRAVGIMRRKGVQHAMTAYRVKFPLLADNMLLHDGMVNAALAQTGQLHWQVCGVVYKPYII